MKTICHFPPRGSRAASLRGFLQISSPGFKCLSNVANRGQMATPTNSTAEISLEREGERGEDETEGGREDGRRLALKSNEELCKKKMSIPIFPPAYSPTRGLEEERSAANTNEKEEFFCFSIGSFEGFLLEAGICLFVYFSTGGSSVFFFAGV